MKLGLTIPLLLAVAALAFACGDSSDTLTIEEYFAELDAIDADVDAQFEEAFAAFAEVEDFEAFNADEANLNVFKDVFGAFPRITADSLDRVKALDPPAQVEDAHNDLVATGDDLVAAYEEGNETVQDAETIAEFLALSEELEPILLAPAEIAFDEACLVLVAVGEENGIAVSVTCESSLLT